VVYFFLALNECLEKANHFIESYEGNKDHKECEVIMFDCEIYYL